MAKPLHSFHAFFFFFFLFTFSSTIFVSSANSESKVPAVFFFGDSIFDAGNNVFKKNCTVQSNFPPYGREFFHRPTGRFTDGRTVPDFIDEYLGMDLQLPYLEVDLLVRSGKLKDYPSNGINFASAGSGVLKDTNQEMGVISLQVQIQQFEELVKQMKIPNETISKALYVLEAGSNDIFFYFIPSTQQPPKPDDFVAAMLSEFRRAVQRLHALGARKVAIFGLGPVGCVPARLNLFDAVVDRCYAPINEMVVKYNLGLEALVNEIPAKLPGAFGVYAATFDVVGLFLRFPQRYGFANVTSACCGGGTLRGTTQCGTGQYEACSDPQEYVFWDNFHPTEHAYQLLFKAFLNGKSSRIRPINLNALINLAIHS